MCGGVAVPVFPASEEELPFLLFIEGFRSGEAPPGPPGDGNTVPASVIPVLILLLIS